MNGNEILKAALLGTDKYTPTASGALLETGARIMAQPTDKEDRFLKLAITTLLYEEAGRKPLHVDGEIQGCPVETLPHINEDLRTQIKTCLSSKDDELFQYFVHVVRKRKQVVTSDVIPQILNMALFNKNIAQGLVEVCGETGKWLCQLNPEWKSLLIEQEEENIWETSSIASRKKYLADIRSSNPAKAIELLKGTIEKESAANRAILAEVLQNNLSLEDEPFLEQLRLDKSQKVKDIATMLLQKLQGSAINMRYLDFLLNVILVKEERYMLISKRKVLFIREDLLPGDDILNTGIDKISSNKDVPDYIYVIGQILRFIDPAILADRLGTTDEELITLILQHKEAQKLIPSLAAAAGMFRNRVWALYMLSKKDVRDLILLEAFPGNERYNYYELFVETHANTLMHYLLNNNNYTIISLSLGKSMIDYFSKSPYVATTAMYRRLALHLPNDVLPHLKQYADSTPTEHSDRYFKSQAVEMMQVIEIRNNIN